MKKHVLLAKMLMILTVTGFLSAFSSQSFAQCINPSSFGNGQLNNNDVPVTNAGVWAGEYTPFAGVISGQNYSFSSSIGSDFLTLTDASNNVLTFGTGPLSWTATFSGDVRVHVSLDASCATANVSRNITAQCTSCPPPTPGPCITPNVWNFYTINGPNPVVEGCALAGFYLEYAGIVAGETYSFTSANAADWLTLSDNVNTPIIFGATSLTWTATFSGTVRLHVSANIACGTDFNCREVTAVCTSCPVPPPGPCIVPTPWQTVSIPNNDVPVTITGQWAGEYGTFNGIQAGQTYTFSSSTATDWLTITDLSNNVLQFGTSAQTWVATISGSVRVHVTTSSACGTQNSSRNITGQCITCPPPTPGDCIHPSVWAFTTVPTTNLPQTYSCMIAGYYLEYSSVTAGQTYTFTSSNTNDWLTLSDDLNNGLLNGASSLTWTATYTGIVRLHVSANIACATDFNCRDITITCDSCDPPIPGDCIHPFLWDFATVPTTNNPTTYSCMVAGYYLEYSSVTAGQTYTFTSGNSNDWLTLTDASNSSILNGGPSITWTATFTGTVRLHVSANIACATDFSCRSITITCDSCDPPVPGPCFGNPWQSATIPNDNTPASVGGQWAGEYATFFGITAGNTYTFSSSVGTDWLTITDEANNVLQFGNTTQTWVATFTGTVRVHCHADAFCTTQNSGRTITGQCTTCTPLSDPCDTAIPAFCNTTVSGTTVGANTQAIPGGFCGTSDGTGGKVWYQLTGTGDQVTLSTCSANTNYDTKIWVFEGVCGNLVCVAGNDDSSCGFSGLHSFVQFNSVNGANYYIIVGGFSSLEGNYEMSITCGAPPAIPECPVVTATSAPCSATDITLTWPAVPTATSYNIYAGTAPGFYDIANPFPFAGTTVFLNNPVANQTYYFLVTAVNGSGESVGCAEFSYVTPDICPPGPCIHPSQFGTSALNACSTANAGVWAGEYTLFTGAVTGNVYEFASSNPTDWLTLTDESDNVITFGTTPLTWTATFDGNVRVHVSTNSGCQTEFASRTISGTCTSCPVPPVPDCPVVTYDMAPCGVNVVTFTWPAVANADSYNVYAGTAPGFYDIANPFNLVETTVFFNNPAPNTTYYFMVTATNCTGSQESIGCTEFSFTTPGACAPPANDLICDAFNVTSSGNTALNTYQFLGDMSCFNQFQNTASATPSPVGPTCGAANGNDVWYTFTSPMCDVGGLVPFVIEFTTDNAGTDYDTKVAIFESSDNTCNGVMTQVACNDDGSSNALCGVGSTFLVSTLLSTNLQPNKQYWVYVGGFNGATGNFNLAGRALAPDHGVAAVGNGTQIELTASNMGANLYTYYYKQVGSTGHSTFNSPSALTDTRTLASGNDYITQVMYRCGTNFDQTQMYRTAPQTINLPQVCPTVQDFSCTFNGNGSYTLTWSQQFGLFTGTNNNLSGYVIKRQPLSSSSVFTFSNPQPVCVDGTCSITYTGQNNAQGYNWWIETRCSANTTQQGNTTTCGPAVNLPNNPDVNSDVVRSNDATFSFTNPAAGVEFVDVQMDDAYNNFFLDVPMLGDYEIYVNDKNEITWRRLDTPIDFNFDFVIVPNPTNAMTTVHMNTIIEEGSYSVVDAMGRTIFSGSINNTDNVNVDATQLQSGVYMVVVTVGNQQLTRRLVVAN
jgi:hypothetical protein